jgi:enamine deaminase RidA (YjgF/YER057c/UK114 family)
LAGGALSIAFMAGKAPAVPLENPRQVSAYNYPADYGPRSPTFSRGALGYLPGQEILFISGTASIVGHQTVHPGDVAGQCRECIANIAAVLGEANRQRRSAPFALDELVYRVYVRDAGISRPSAQHWHR